MKKTNKRLKEIVRIIHKHKLLKDRSPENIRLMFEELGPTFIKMGQILASRGDIITEEYALEFKKLRCSVNAMDITTVKDILEEEYEDYKSIFKSISPEVLGAASIAQTHLAYLNDDTLVVLKVQRKDIYDIMKMDAMLLKKAISILHLNKIFGSIADLNAVIDEIFKRAEEEMDFEKEANHIIEFAYNNKDISYIKPLVVYKEYSTKHILVMDYVGGCFIDEIDNLKTSGYDLEEISYKLADNYLKQVIDDGFYHADPHPDNIKISNGKIAYLDLGMMGRLSNQHKTLLNKCIIGIVMNNINDVSYALTALNINKQEVDYIKLNKGIERLLNKNKVTDIANIDIKCFIKDVYQLLNENNIKLPQDITMLVRGITVLEGTLEAINPGINLLGVLKNRIGLKDIFSKENIEMSLLNGLKSVKSLLEIPNETLKFLKGMNEGKVNFNIKISDSKDKIRSKEFMFWTGVIVVLDITFVLGLSIISVLGKENLEFIYNLYILGFITCTIMLVIRYFINRKGR